MKAPSFLLFALVLLLPAAALAAPAATPLNTAILIDFSLPMMGGRGFASSFEGATAVPGADGRGAMIELVPMAPSPALGGGMFVPSTPMPNNTAGIAAGALGGALGNAMVRAAMEKERLKSLAPMQLAIPGQDLAQRFIAGLEREAARHGLAVSSSNLRGIPDKYRAATALKQPGIERVITVSRYALPILGVTRDDRRPVLLATLSLYGRKDGMFRHLAMVNVAYIGRSAPGPLAPVASWAQDKGAAYLAEVDEGARAMMAALLTPSVAWAAAIKPDKGADPDAVRMLAVADGLAFARMHEVLTVVVPLPSADPAPHASR